jgi:hypothetical protein
MVVAFASMIALCVVFIIVSIKDDRPEEIGVPITIIIFMIIAIVMYIRDPESLTRENKDEPILEVTQETESKTNTRFTEEVYKTDKGNKVYILTDTETGCQYIWYRNGITKLENTEVE